MPIVQHYACTEPPHETVICHFMKLWKFQDMFSNDELYFRRTDKYKADDPYESLPSDEFVRKALGLRKFYLEDEQQLANEQAFTRQHSESCFLSCWQIYEGETNHMWDRYGEVAVFTRFELLRAAVDAFPDQVLVGLVRYSEEDLTRYNLIDFLFRKRGHFEKERELRVVVQSYNPMAGMNRNVDESNVAHREPLDEVNPLPAWVHDEKRRRVDLKSLITEIRLWPWATRELREEIYWWHKNKNFDCPITDSELTSPFNLSPDQVKSLPKSF
jgi:hypothetical protein